MSKTDGGPAYPAIDRVETVEVEDVTISERFGSYGMSLRDYFAGQALMGVIANKSRPISFLPKDDAAFCYTIADAMLAEREPSDE